MQIDVRADPTVLKRKSVVDLSSGDDIVDIAYADDDTGTYGVWKRKEGYKSEIVTDANGNPVVVEHSPGRGAIRIVRRG